MEGPPQTRTSKFKLSNCLSWTHEIFRIDKCDEKIKFGVPQWGDPPQKALPKLMVFIHLS